MDNEADDPVDVGRMLINKSSTAADLAVSLPPDVLTEILIRLPVRSILRFKSVRKSWYALISGPEFVEKHLKASTENKDYANHRLIMNSYFYVDVKSCSIPSILHEKRSTAHPLDNPLGYTMDELRIAGSVNGLVLIVVDQVDLFLWNPATRVSKRLPPSGFENKSCQSTAYGFGYNQTSSDYNVIFTKTGGRFKGQAKIYGLRSNSWSEIENFPDYGELIDDFGKFVSGALHWGARFGTGFNDNWGVLAFKMSEETFSEISPPCFGDRCFGSGIGVLDGCLCMLSNYDRTTIDVWVMKEYGKVESWAKMFSVPFRHHPTQFHDFAIKPLFISRTNEVILMIGYKLVLYDAETNKVRRPVVKKFCEIPEVDTYVETLVSPYSECSGSDRSSV